MDGSFGLLLAAARHANLYVKATRIDGISAQDWPHADVHAYVKAVYEAFGPERVLGCTGFPESPLRGDAVGFRVIEEALDFLSAEDKEWLLGGTADALYRRSAD
jgi:predicted TIM-barrel fold metal-dependent hydrolase